MKDKIKLFAIAIVIFACFVGVIAYVGSSSGKKMIEMSENQTIKQIILTHIAETEHWNKIDSVILLPEQSQHGLYLSGKFKGFRHGNFTYDVKFNDGTSIDLKVEWRSPKDGPQDKLVITNYSQ